MTKEKIMHFIIIFDIVEKLIFANYILNTHNYYWEINSGKHCEARSTPDCYWAITGWCTVLAAVTGGAPALSPAAVWGVE